MSDESASHHGELAPGSQLAGYRLEEQIGRGGMAVVYRARDLRLDRRVALKVLEADVADDEFRERFIRESRAAAAVDHPHIIPIYDAGEIGRILYIAMRYIEGGDVWALLRRHGPLSLERVCVIVGQVASALDAAHAHGLVHRDVKPANILLDRSAGDGRTDHVYLSDFGVTKSSLALPGLTSTGQFVGTLDYVAPEQIEGRHVDGRADAYALACTAFEMLSGAPPFDRNQGMAAIWARISQPAPPLTARRRDLHASIDAVFAKSLAKSPDDRYPDCHGFAAALRAVSRRAQTPAPTLPPTPTSASTSPPVSASPPASPPSAPPDLETQGVRPPAPLRAAPQQPAAWTREEPPAAVRAMTDVAKPTADEPTTDSGPATEPRLRRPPPPPAWPAAPDPGTPARERTRADERPQRSRRILVLLSALIVVAAAGAAAGLLISCQAGPIAARHGGATGQPGSPGSYQNGAYAGPGCPAAAGASATAAKGPGGDGWAGVGGGLAACGGNTVASRKTGDVAAQDTYTWTFQVGGPARCSIKIYIANVGPSSGTAHYGVYGTDLTQAAQIATFDIPQAQLKGRWVAVGPWPTGTGVLQIQLSDRAAYAGDRYHVTASAAQASCH